MSKRQIYFEKKINTPRLVGDAVATYQRYDSGLRPISFCVSVAHSEAAAAAYNGACIPAARLDDEITEYERYAVVRRYA